MNVSSSPFRSLTAQLGRLAVSSVSVARTSVRLGSSTRRSRRERVEPDFLPGHGEKIWLFTNFITGQTVYSHNPVPKVRIPPPLVASGEAGTGDRTATARQG